MKNMMKPLGLALTLALLATAPASAQEHPQHPQQDQHQGHDMKGMEGHGMQGMHQGQMGMGQGHCMAMMGGMMGKANPVMALHHAEALGLSEEQVSELKDRMASAHEAGMSHMRLAMETRASAEELLDADTPDLAAYEARLENAAGHMVQAHVAIARAGVDARTVLTPEQRAQLDAMPMDHGMGNGHGMSGMSAMGHEGCPMMMDHGNGSMMDHGSAENPHTNQGGAH